MRRGALPAVSVIGKIALDRYEQALVAAVTEWGSLPDRMIIVLMIFAIALGTAWPSQSLCID